MVPKGCSTVSRRRRIFPCQYRRHRQPGCWRENRPFAHDMTKAPIGAFVIFGLDPWSSFLLRAALREAVGLAVHFQNVDVVGQAVEERSGHRRHRQSLGGAEQKDASKAHAKPEPIIPAPESTMPCQDAPRNPVRVSWSRLMGHVP